MTTAAWILVLLPVAVGLYAYVVYPGVLLLVASRVTSGRVSDATPMVSVVVPAYNEQAQIAGALDALLAQDYPADRLQILVISDASSDDTDSIVNSYGPRGVELLRMAERSGKTKAENAASPLLRGDIIVNTDSSIRLHPKAVKELIARMDDPSVGVASGRDVSIAAASSANSTEAGYVGYEMWVRALETRAGGIVGASGSCYAIRSQLHRIPVRDDLSRDFSAALTAEANGYRAISVDEAICFVPRTGSLQREFRRKVRTIARGMNTLYARRELLDPSTHGLFAWKLFSHKACRWLLPLSVVPAMIGLVVLAVDNSLARAALVVVIAVAALALTGANWPPERSMPRLISTASFGVAANLAVIYAFWRFILGRNDAVWEPTRREAATR